MHTYWRLCTLTLILLVALLTGTTLHAHPLAQGEVTATTTPVADCIDPLDALIMMDVSNSMRSQLEVAQRQSADLLATLRRAVPDLQVGIASVADYPHLGGRPGDYPWQLDQPLTANFALVQNALERIKILHGGDGPEIYVRALYEAGNATQIGWRDAARHMIIFWGDATAHDPDPGPDGEPGTPDDLHFDAVLDDLRARGIRIYAISFADPTDFQRMADQTGGVFLPADAAAQLPTLITEAVQRECAAPPPPVAPRPPSSDSVTGVPSRFTLPDGFDWWWLLPLLLIPLLLLLLLWKRQTTRRAIQRGMPLPAPAGAELLPVLQPPVVTAADPLPPLVPLRVGARPALVVGLGQAGRWTLTYLKHILHERGGLDAVTLLAIDVPPSDQHQDEASIGLDMPDATDGLISIELDASELLWLRADPDYITALIERNPEAYPVLHAWLQSGTGTAPHTTARIQLLAELPSLAPRLTAALDALAQRQGSDVYLVAGLGEAVGAGAVLDLAQALQLSASRANRTIALHGMLYLPDVLEHAQPRLPETHAAAFAVWRTLERLQTTFGQQPPTPLLFDPPLLGDNPVAPLFAGKLFSTCALVSHDRDVSPLLRIAAAQGVYPMVADSLAAMLELPAANHLHEQQANINSRASLAQHTLDTALYRSVGSFTYQLDTRNIIGTATAQVITALVDHLLAAEPEPAVNLSPFLSQLLSVGDYDLYRQITGADNALDWSRTALLDWLEPAATRGTLSRLTSDSLVRHIRYELLTTGQRGGPAIRRLLQQYLEMHLGTASVPGVWPTAVASHAQAAVQIFQQTLLEHSIQLLNSTTPGALSRALALCAALQQHLATLHTTLAARAQSSAETLPDLRATAESEATSLDRRGFHLWRWLIGDPLTPRQEQVLTLYQQWLDAELEALVLRESAGATAMMQACAQHMHDQLQAQAALLQTTRQTACTHLQVLRDNRAAQVALGRVRHTWGMPHTDVTDLQAYVDPEQPLPRNERTRRYAQDLRAYLDGQHISHLLAQRPAAWPDPLSTLLERLCWSWEAPAGAATPSAAITLYPVWRDSHGPQRLTSGMALWANATALYGWITTLRLPDLLVPELPAPAQVAQQLTDERASPPIRYRPTERDQHELHTFLIVPPATAPDSSHLFEQVVAAQQQTGALRAFHQHLPGGDSQRLTYLTSYELIGALHSGALPTYDLLAATYEQQTTNRSSLALAVNEAIAHRYEQQRRVVRRRLHPRLVDALQDQARLELFAHALLTGTIGPDREGTGQIVAWIDGQQAFTLSPPANDGQSPWLAALRWLIIAADAATIQRVTSAVQAALPRIDDAAYDDWMQQGLLTRLQQSRDPAEQDLAAVLQVVLEQTIETLWEASSGDR